jgi:hypothetical protein
MGLFGKAEYEMKLEAIEAAESCISAAILGTDYVGRLDKYMDDLVEIPRYFWARCPVTMKKMEKPGPDVAEIARVIYALAKGDRVDGFIVLKNGTRVATARYYQSVMERIKRKLKGKLLFTVSILKDGDKRAKCNAPKLHKQPCKCKALSLATLANEEWQAAMEEAMWD